MSFVFYLQLWEFKEKNKCVFYDFCRSEWVFACQKWFLKNHQFVIQFCLFHRKFWFLFNCDWRNFRNKQNIPGNIFFKLLFKDCDLFWCLSFSLYFQNFNNFQNCSSVHIKAQINCFLNEDYIKNIWSEVSRNENS